MSERNAYEPGVPCWIDTLQPDVHVDEAAARAERLGGSTLSPPTDDPVGRSAVLADPAGVAFSVSKVTL